jgi:hypothetical protein
MTTYFFDSGAENSGPGGVPFTRRTAPCCRICTATDTSWPGLREKRNQKTYERTRQLAENKQNRSPEPVKFLKTGRLSSSASRNPSAEGKTQANKGRPIDISVESRFSSSALELKIKFKKHTNEPVMLLKTFKTTFFEDGYPVRLLKISGLERLSRYVIENAHVVNNMPFQCGDSYGSLPESRLLKW